MGRRALARPFIGLLTGARTEHAELATERRCGLVVWTAVTLGLGEQSVAAESAAALAPGGAATLSVRPEAIRVLREGALPAGSTGLAGTVAEVVYLGSSVRVAVASGELVIWAELRDEEASGLEVGAPVRASWRPAAATIWAGEGT